jgi:hypothetical protein
MEAAGSSKTFVSTKQHGVSSQKTVIIVATLVRTWNFMVEKSVVERIKQRQKRSHLIW